MEYARSRLDRGGHWHMASMKILPTPVRQPLTDQWDLLVTQCGMATRSLRMVVTLMNGDPKAQFAVGVGIKADEQRLVDGVVKLTGLLPEVIRAELVLLNYNVEGVWRELLAAGPKRSENLPGQSFNFENIEGWDDPVDGAALLDEIRNTYNRFAILPPGAADALSLWVLHTYVIEAFDVTPYIDVWSPVKGCGKTRVVEISAELVYRPVETVNATTAAVFRLIDQWMPTLLVDEQDSFMDHSNELRGVLNAGYKRGATIPRVVGDNQEVRQFETFGPKMLAGIGNLPPTLRDRSIRIAMEKKGDQKVEKWTRRSRLTLAPIRRRCLRWANDNVGQFSDIEPTMPANLTDRAEEIWEPLFQIAIAAGGDWPDRAKQAVDLLQGKDITSDDVRLQLLSDLRDIFSTRDRVASDDLPGLLHPIEDRPWSEYGRSQKPITKGQIQSILRSFSVKAKRYRDDDDRHYGYEKKQFLETFSRYLGIQNGTAGQTSNDADLRRFSERDNKTAVPFEKTAETRANKGLSRCPVSEQGDKVGMEQIKANSPFDTCPKCGGRASLVGSNWQCGSCPQVWRT